MSVDNDAELIEIISSMETLRLNCDGLEKKLKQHQEKGIENLKETTLCLNQLKLLCRDIVEDYFSSLLRHLTGVTSVTYATINDRIERVENLKLDLTETFGIIEETREDLKVSAEMSAVLNTNLTEVVTNIADDLFSVGAKSIPSWPAPNFPGNSTGFMESMKSIVDVNSLQEIQEAVLELSRLHAPADQSSICNELEWIQLSLAIRPNMSSTVAPYITAEVFLSGVSLKCEVYCLVKFESLELWLQSPPCRGIGELTISIQCFNRDVPGSPLHLQIQEGRLLNSQSSPPNTSKSCFMVPHNSVDDNTKQWPERSVLTGCICGKLTAARRAAALVSDSDFDCSKARETCPGDCMKGLQLHSSHRDSSVPTIDSVIKKYRPKMAYVQDAAAGTTSSSSGKERRNLPDYSQLATKKIKEEVVSPTPVVQTPASQLKIRDNTPLDEEQLSYSPELDVSPASPELRPPPRALGAKKPLLPTPKHAPIVFDLKGEKKQTTDINGNVLKPKRAARLPSPSKKTSLATPQMEEVKGGDFVSLNAKQPPVTRKRSDTTVKTPVKGRGKEVLSDEDYMGDLSPTSEEMSLREVVRDKLHGRCVQLFPADGEDRTIHFKNPVGVTQLPDGSVVICDTFNNRLVHFTADAKTHQILPASPPLTKPSASTMLPFDDTKSYSEQEVCFAVKDHKAIYIFGMNCQQLRVLALNKLCKPYGLSVDEYGDLVTVETACGSNLCITKVNPLTGSLRRVPFCLTNPLDGTGSVSKPRFIACHRNNNLIIVDLGLDIIAMVSMTDGHLIRSFGGKGSKPGLFHDPSGVVCDADGFIIIGDSRNHRIQVFAPDGTFLSVLKIDRPVRRPSGFCLTPCGHLLVVNYWQNNVAKYLLTIH